MSTRANDVVGKATKDVAGPLESREIDRAIGWSRRVAAEAQHRLAERGAAMGREIAATIERAWRAGVRSVHPDRARIGEERAATQRTARLNIAREWLMDPSKRARYDELRRPSPKVEIPYIDPLGAWPERPRTRARAAGEPRRRRESPGRTHTNE